MFKTAITVTITIITGTASVNREETICMCHALPFKLYTNFKK